MHMSLIAAPDYHLERVLAEDRKLALVAVLAERVADAIDSGNTEALRSFAERVRTELVDAYSPTLAWEWANNKFDGIEEES